MAKTRYVWDYATDSYLLEKDDAGVATAMYTNEPVQYGSLVSQRQGGATSYYHFDGQQSIRELTEASGTVTDRYTYSAFGEAVATSGGTVNPLRAFGVTSCYQSGSIVELYSRAGFYSPATARWASLAVSQLGYSHNTLTPPIKDTSQISTEATFLSADINSVTTFTTIASSAAATARPCTCHGCHWTHFGILGSGSLLIGYGYARVIARCSKAELRAYRHYDCNGSQFQKAIHCFCEAHLSFHTPSLGIQAGIGGLGIVGSFNACKDTDIGGGFGWSASIQVIIGGGEAGGDFSGTSDGDYGGVGIQPGADIGINLNWTFVNVRSSRLKCVREPLNAHDRATIRNFGPCKSHDVRVRPPEIVDNPHSVRSPS